MSVSSLNGKAIITNCYNTGSVGGDWYVGGIMGGFDGTATITNCYNTGSVSGSSYVGGIVGDGLDALIVNCYYLKTSSVNAIGRGPTQSGSYYGTFDSETSNVDRTSSAGLAYSGNILNVLNEYREDNPTYNGITLSTWISVNGGYPVFA